jgi:hypothetical protein
MKFITDLYLRARLWYWLNYVVHRNVLHMSLRINTLSMSKEEINRIVHRKDLIAFINSGMELSNVPINLIKKAGI